MDDEIGSLTRPPQVPPAARAVRKGWRDVRLWLGLALVALSVVGGARLFAARDDTVAVWRATADLQPGLPVDPASLTRVRVHFDSDADADRYLLAEDGDPAGQVVRAVGAGELVPVAAVDAQAHEALTTVSMELPSAQVPGHVAPGSRVDLWVRPDTAGGVDPPLNRGTGRAHRLLDDVLVLEAPRPDALAGMTTTRQIVVGVAAGTPDDDLQELMEAIGTTRVMVSGELSR